MSDIIRRINPFCVISKMTFGDYEMHDIQVNSSWNVNPYKDYAVVPDEMVNEITATHGFCDLELNEDETEVVSFTRREIPQIPKEEPEPSSGEILDALLGVE